MKTKFLTALVAILMVSTAQAQMIPSFDIELGYSVSTSDANSIQSLRFVKDNGVSVHLDINTQGGYVPSGFAGGPNELGGLYIAYDHTVFQELMEGFSLQIAAGLIVDGMGDFGSTKWMNPQQSFKSTVRYSLPVEQVDANLELCYLFTSDPQRNGLFVGLSSRWSLFK